MAVTRDSLIASLAQFTRDLQEYTRTSAPHPKIVTICELVSGKGALTDHGGRVWMLVMSKLDGYQLAVGGEIDVRTANVERARLDHDGTLRYENSFGTWYKAVSAPGTGSGIAGTSYLASEHPSTPMPL